MRKWRGMMGGMELWITEQMPSADATDVIVLLCGLDEEDVAAQSALPLARPGVGLITVEPRGGGLNSSSRALWKSLVKAGLYVGITPVTLWMRDLREVLAAFRARGDLEGKKVYLYGARDAGTACLYTALFDPAVEGVIIHDIRSTHRKGGHILGILKVLDVEQAIGLLAPRVFGLDTQEWEFVFWGIRVYERLGVRERFVHTHSMAHTLAQIFGVSGG